MIGTKHEAWISKGNICLCNEEDGFYIQTFQNREELEEFITELQQLAEEAWPKQSI
jgi:hypothetical protein